MLANGGSFEKSVEISNEWTHATMMAGGRGNEGLGSSKN